MPDEFVRPDADTALDGWTDQADGTTSIYTKIDETSAGDSDFVQSPVIVALQADLVVRLYEGATEIAEWTHTDIGETFTTAEQTLTSPQLAAITDFDDLFIELDDNAGSVYRMSLGNPAGALTTPVVVRYRYKKLLVEEEPSYEGPGDIKAGALGWWGLRAYSAAQCTGSVAAIRIVKASDGTAAQDINILTDGSLDVATVSGLGYAVKVTTVYDQSGAGLHMTQATLSAMPSLTLSGIGSLPCLTSAGGTVGFTNATGFGAVAQPFTISQVFKRTTIASYANYFAATGSTVGLFTNNAADGVLMYVGFSLPVSTAADNVFHSGQFVYNNTTGFGYVDGSSTSANLGSSTGWPSGAIFWGSGAGRDWVSGAVTEVGFWGSAFSGGDAAAMDTNQSAYWGI